MEGSAMKERISWTNLLVFTGMLLAGMFIGNFIAFLIALPFTGFAIDPLIKIVESPQLVPGSRAIMMLMQGIIAIITFIITPIFYARYFDQNRIADILERKKVRSISFIALGVLVIAMLPFNAGIVELFDPELWPESLRGIAKSISELDGQYDEMASFFIDFDSITEFLLAIVVMAIIPAFGEELVFRGIFQPYFIKLTGKAFTGIFISSLIFAAFHFQVSGLFPRLILGMAFGYLYYWSGNIYLPVFGHFMNNAFSLVLAGLYKVGYIDIDISGDIPVTLFQALTSLVFSVLLFLALKRDLGKVNDEQNEKLASGL